MLTTRFHFTLPEPWRGQTFDAEGLEPLTFLVGPNGSGKSRFAEVLKGVLPNARLLGTDRMTGMSKNEGFGLFGDNLAGGFQKQYFGHFRSAGTSHGSGIDTFVLLEDRPDVRVLVEATLSHLFSREIHLEWDSGNLVPRATLASTGASYRVDREECHGIKELLILLTHLYNDAHQWLIIDEPELNLHPQFQSFLMQEIRKIAGKPEPGKRKKGIILITHSPFMIDLRSLSDLKSVWTFSIDHNSPPKSLAKLGDESVRRLSTLVPRLNVHHKQLFFSDNPIFVEGILDEQLFTAIQERRGVSISAAGSCLIDVGGSGEVSKYLDLCRALGKKAYFVYDLDSLFLGNLRQCIQSEDQLSRLRTC